MNTTMKVISATLLALVSTSVASAADAALEKCAVIESNLERLACYDLATGRNVSTSKVLQELPKAKQTASESLSPMQKAWELGLQPSHNFVIRPYRAVYLLPFFETTDVHALAASGRCYCLIGSCC